jgi:hypothetical protein
MEEDGMGGRLAVRDFMQIEARIYQKLYVIQDYSRTKSSSEFLRT